MEGVRRVLLTHPSSLTAPGYGLTARVGSEMLLVGHASFHPPKKLASLLVHPFVKGIKINVDANQPTKKRATTDSSFATGMYLRATRNRLTINQS